MFYCGLIKAASTQAPVSFLSLGPSQVRLCSCRDTVELWKKKWKTLCVVITHIRTVTQMETRDARVQSVLLYIALYSRCQPAGQPTARAQRQTSRAPLSVCVPITRTLTEINSNDSICVFIFPASTVAPGPTGRAQVWSRVMSSHHITHMLGYVDI